MANEVISQICLDGIVYNIKDNSVPKQINNITNEFNKLKSDKADAIQHKSGSIITADNSAYTPVKGLKLFGKTTQFTTTGKNLFGGEALADKLVAEAQAIKDETNGTVKYTALQGSGVRLFEPPKQNTQYTLVLYGMNTGSLPRCNMHFGYTDGTGEDFNFSKVGELSYFVKTSNSSKQLSYLACWNNSDSTILHYDMCGIFEGVVTLEDFEPYTGGIASPNPDYPQELVSAGASGAIKTTVCGKNLYNPSIITAPYGTYVRTETGIIATKTRESSYTNIRFCIPSTMFTTDKIYILSYIADTYVNRVRVGEANSIQDTSTYNKYKNASVANDDKVTFTITDITKPYICIQIDHTTVAVGESYSLANIQVEEGSVATDYEPYKGQALTASTPNGLPGIPVSSGGNYTDENGQQWICDEIDFARGVYVKRLETLALKGTESIWGAATIVPGRMRFALTLGNNMGFDPNYVANSLRCNYYQTISEASVYEGEQGISLGSMLWIGDMRFADATAFNANLATLYAEGNPVTVMYQLAEPIETPLSAEEMAAYAALHTNKPNTTVYNDSGADMELTYYTPTTAVQMVHSPADEGKILSIDQHGCVVLKEDVITWNNF